MAALNKKMPKLQLTWSSPEPWCRLEDACAESEYVFAIRVVIGEQSETRRTAGFPAVARRLGWSGSYVQQLP